MLRITIHLKNNPFGGGLNMVVRGIKFYTI